MVEVAVICELVSGSNRWQILTEIGQL